MLQQFAAEDGGEVFVRIREWVFFRVEMIDLAGEGLAIGAGNFTTIGASEFPVVAPADLAVP